MWLLRIISIIWSSCFPCRVFTGMKAVFWLQPKPTTLRSRDCNHQYLVKALRVCSREMFRVSKSSKERFHLESGRVPGTTANSGNLTCFAECIQCLNDTGTILLSTSSFQIIVTVWNSDQFWKQTVNPILSGHCWLSNQIQFFSPAFCKYFWALLISPWLQSLQQELLPCTCRNSQAQQLVGLKQSPCNVWLSGNIWDSPVHLLASDSSSLLVLMHQICRHGTVPIVLFEIQVKASSLRNFKASRTGFVC